MELSSEALALQHKALYLSSNNANDFTKITSLVHRSQDLKSIFAKQLHLLEEPIRFNSGLLKPKQSFEIDELVIKLFVRTKYGTIIIP